MNNTVLFQALVYLAAAVVCVPVAKRLGLGSVLGYLFAGVLLGPHVSGLVGHDSTHVMHFAEFGVVMMLFLVGLELRPALLWQLRRPIFGLGGLQVLATAAVVTAIAAAVGMPWQSGVAIGLILAMSSTAIVLQSLAERGLLKTSGGQASFAVLLFQDLSVIPILAVFPLLSSSPATTPDGATRPGWQQALLILGAVAAIVLFGRFVVRPAFRALAATRLRELFTAFALLLVVGIAWLMQAVGLSPALGTFLAGVVLADSEYRHELESDIEPFKGLLLGLFFISVGATIRFPLIAEQPVLIAGLVLGIMALKLAVVFGLGRIFRLETSARWLSAFALLQVGEFAFVLVGLGESSHVYTAATGQILTAVIALSMLLTPAAFLILERWVLPRVAQKEAARPADAVSHDGATVVMAGFGRVGQVVGRMLRMAGFGVTVLDLDPAIVDMLRRLGQQVYYGDASRLDLLTAAGCDRAKLFVLAVDDPEKSFEIAELVHRHFPALPILARVRNRQHYYRLRRLGITDLFRETLGSSLEMGQKALRKVGVRAHTAHRIAERWRAHDEAALEGMLQYSGGDANTWMAEAKKALANFERAMRDELDAPATTKDPGWDNESLREEVAARYAATAPVAASAARPGPSGAATEA